jgi:hypothetical protein
MNRTLLNQQVNKKLRKLFKDKGITRCELCSSDWGLTYAHRHKRRWYYGQENLLSDFNQVLLLCLKCHNRIEYDQELTNQIFERLR